MLISDSNTTHTLLAGLLDHATYRLKVSNIDDDIAAIIAQANPHLILIESQHPHVAFALIEQLGAITRQSIPLVLICEADAAESIHTALDLGAADYIVMPLTATVVQHRLRSILHTHHLVGELAAHRKQLDGLNRISQIILQAQQNAQYETLYSDIVQVAARLIDVPIAYFIQVDDTAQQIAILGEYTGGSHLQPDRDRQLPLSNYPLLQQWLKAPHHNRTIHIAELTNPPSANDAFYRQIDAKTVLWVPIWLGDEFAGYLSFWENRSRRDFDEVEAELLQAIALQLGWGLQSIRLYDALRQSEAQLRQDADLLAANNRELDAFAYTVAHDLKNPLNSVLNYAQYATDFESEQLSADGHDALQKIRFHAESMGVMIDQLLLLTAQQDISLRPVEVEAALLTVEGRLEYLLRTRGVALKIADQIPRVLGHQIYLEEILSNLVSNAIKYCGADNPAPRITIQHVELGNEVRIEVVDNGIGIAPQRQTELFKMFARGNHAAEGMGLGLAIVQRLVERMGGTVGLTSQVNIGSKFWFQLMKAE